MALKRMDNVLIVVEDLEAVKAFFIELGLKLECVDFRCLRRHPTKPKPDIPRPIKSKSGA